MLAIHQDNDDGDKGDGGQSGLERWIITLCVMEMLLTQNLEDGASGPLGDGDWLPLPGSDSWGRDGSDAAVLR